jgi:arabinogalactan oligomer/maltooligosaccharide transport system substrate-binding protein
MRSSKNLISLAGLTLIGLIGLTGCAADPEPKVDSLTVWVDELEAKALEGAAAEFKTDTGITVNLVVNQDPRGNFLSSSTTGEGPDVVAGAHDWIGDLVANKVIEPIELGARAGEFQDNAVAAFKYESKTYGLPSTVQSLALICNAKKVPTQPNWDQVKKAGLALSLNAGGGDPYHLYTIQTSFGAHVFKKDGDGNFKPDLDLDNGGLDFANWLAVEGSKILDAGSTWDSSVKALQSGSKGCWITGPWVSGVLDLNTDEYNIYKIPSVGGKDAVSFLSVRGFYVSANSKDTFYAKKFVVDYLGKSETQTELFKVSGRIPANKSAREAAKDDRVVQGFADASQNAEPLPAIPAMASVWASWGATQMQILTGKAEPKAAWTKMISDIEAAIAN